MILFDYIIAAVVLSLIVIAVISEFKIHSSQDRKDSIDKDTCEHMRKNGMSEKQIKDFAERQCIKYFPPEMREGE